MDFFHTRRAMVAALVLFESICAIPFSSQNLFAEENLDKTQVERLGYAIAQVKHAYIVPESDEKIFSNAINGILSGLDPHSGYLNEEEMKLLQDKTQGEFQGLGIEIMLDNSNLVSVVSVLEDSPAYKAGVRRGDTIIAINNVPLFASTTLAAIKKLRGKSGTTIQLTLVRSKEESPRIVAIKRSAIRIHSVKSQLIDNRFGYIRIVQFQTNTANDVREAVHTLQMQARGSLAGLVLDLRDNPGGLLTQATEVADLFLDSNALGSNKMIVYTKGRLASSQMKILAKPKDYLNGAPLVVLINGGSASGAEILAGALQDHKRATIVGSRSFGKGSIQSVIPIDRKTGIKLTTALYYTPYGHVIQAQGITPDIPIDQSTVEDGKKDSDKPLFQIYENQLDGHLQQGATNSVGKEKELPMSASELMKFSKEDHQLYEAFLVLESKCLSK